MTAHSPKISFTQALAVQHQWPPATFAGHLFARSAWLAAAEHWPLANPSVGPRAGAQPPTANPAHKVVFRASEALAPASWELLERMAAAMHLAPASFAIWPNSTGQSWPELLKVVRPKVIIALGSAALEQLTGKRERLSQTHGQLMAYPPPPEAGLGETAVVSLMATFHPDFLLINPAMKRPVWQDLQKVMRYLASN